MIRKYLLFLLLAPLTVLGQTPTPRSVTLSWNGSANTPTATYNVYRWTSTDTAGFTKINQIPVTTVIPCVPPVTGQTCYTYTDATVITGKTYSYKVTASNAGQESAATPEVDAVIFVIAVVGPPSNLQIIKVQ